MHPAASIEYRVRHRSRTRLHVEHHPVLADHVQLSMVVNDADLEITLSEAEARSLAEQIMAHADLIAAAFPQTSGGAA